jgi:hypothetical protein
MPAFAIAQSSWPNASTHRATASRLPSIDRTSPESPRSSAVVAAQCV